MGSAEGDDARVTLVRETDPDSKVPKHACKQRVRSIAGDLLRGEIVHLGLRPALSRREACEVAGIASTTPLDEMRRVETFTTEKSTELASIARVGLLEDPPLDLGGEPPSLGFRRQFRRGV